MVNLFIQGISPEVPVVAILFILTIAIFVAWWSYQHLDTIPAAKKRWLIVLRSSSLFVLIVLLFNPYLLVQNESVLTPVLAVYIDDSQSLSIARGEYNGLSNYNDILDRFHETPIGNFGKTSFLFSESIQEGDRPALTGTRTNIHSLLEHLRENEHQFTAAILFSDGIVTQGRNPVFAAQHISIPIITVPVGDTTQVRDIAIADVEYSRTTYTFTREVITVDIQQDGFEGESSTVQFIKDGEIIQTEVVEFPATSSSHVLEFYYQFDEPGFYDFEINIPPKAEEFTDQNNRSAFTIEVLDDKTQILSLAFEVHPDVGTIRRLIASDQQNELISSAWIGDDRYIGSDPYNLDRDIGLIVLHGLPPIGSRPYEWILSQQVPMLVFKTPGSSERFTNPEISDITGFYTASSSGAISVQIDYQSGFNSHPILELGTVTSGRLPSLNTLLGEYRLSALSQPLIFANFERTTTDIPIIIATDAINYRKTSVTAFGWHRFERSNQTETREFFKNLFTNIISWTSTSPDSRTLYIYTQKDSFTENETVQIRAELFNERGEPETDAQIEVSIFESEMDTPLQTFIMTHNQNEFYSVDVGNYPMGMYRISATATKNNRIIGTAEGRVNVSESIIEYLNTRRDDSLLRQIAELTGGIFLENHEFDRLIPFLESAEAEETNLRITEDFHYLYSSGYWFLIVLVLLSIEWLIRRSVSLP